MDRPALPLLQLYILHCQMLFDELNPSAKVSFLLSFSWWFSFLRILLLDRRVGPEFHYALPTCHGNTVPCRGNAVAPSYCVAGLTQVSLVPSSVGV